jgi:hypothetical protein
VAEIKAGKRKAPVAPKKKKKKAKQQRKKLQPQPGNLPTGVFGFGEKLRRRIRTFE